MYSPFMWDAGAMLGLGAFAFVAIIAGIWALFWKGLALWHAGRNGQKIWFIVLLLVNTVGILEIVYLLWFRADHDTRPFRSLFFPAKPSESSAV